MLNKKLDIGLRYIMIFLLTATLIVTLSYGWYVSNKVVTANGITATTSSSNITVSNHGVYKVEVGNLDDQPYPTDKPVENDEELINGLLSGDLIYYSITIKSVDTSIKNLKLDIRNIDGGSFFTCHPVIDNGDVVPEISGKKYIYNEKVKDKLDPIRVEAQMYKYSDINTDPLLPKLNVGKPEERAISNGEFFYKVKEGVKYRYYIYEDKDQANNVISFNTCDLYKIRLYDVFTGPLNAPVKVPGMQESTYREFTRPAGSENIELYNLYNYNSWDSKAGDEITFKFEIKFEIGANIPQEITRSSISNRDFIFNNILVGSEVVSK